MAFGGHTTNYTSSAKWSNVTAWSAGATIAAGALRRQSTAPAVNNERVFVAIVGGTTHATTEPTWNVTRGSTTTDNTVTWQEATGLAALNGDLTHTPSWATMRAASTTADKGHVIKDNAGTHIFIQGTASNTVGGSEPSWNTAAVGNTTVDGNVTWTYLGTSFSNWSSPHKLLQNMLAAGWGDAGVPTWFFVGSDHAESNASAISWPNRGSDTAPISILCVDVAGSVPPVSADLRTTATATVTGGVAINLQGFLRICYGITFILATGQLSLQQESTVAKKFYHSCNFQWTGNGGSGALDSNGAGVIECYNCTIKFVNASSQWTGAGRILWRDSVLFDAGGTYASTLVSWTTNSHLTIRNCDLNAISGKTMFAGANAIIIGELFDCKIPSSFTLAVAANITSWRQQLFMTRCDSGTGDYRSELYDFYGALTTETTAVRTGGASNGTTGFSWKLVTTTKSSLYNALKSFPIGKKNPTTGADVTVTLHGIINAAAVPNNDELYMEVSYLGTSGNPLGVLKSTQVADVLATPAALTADSSSAWDSVAAARQNTHTYIVGDIIKVATNPGRIFFCTAVSGNNAGSEPAGYASAVDGGSVTDGSATFRAGCRFTMAKTLTSPQPQLSGLLTAVVKAAKVSTTYYIDPYISLS